jgi:Flp pilus assembly protein TadB
VSKERQRRRAQEAERARRRARTAKQGERRAAAEPHGTRPAAKASRGRKQPVYRQRRFPPLPLSLKLLLALFWLAAAVAVYLLVPSWTARIGFLVIATMALPLIVVILRDPTRRPR